MGIWYTIPFWPLYRRGFSTNKPNVGMLVIKRIQSSATHEPIFIICAMVLKLCVQGNLPRCSSVSVKNLTQAVPVSNSNLTTSNPHEELRGLSLFRGLH